MSRLLGILGILLWAQLGTSPADVTPPDCRSSPECKEEGRCQPDQGQGCVARSRADCAQSEVCRQGGYCTPVGGECVIRSASDCQRSRLCKTAGLCIYHPASGGHSGRPEVAAACVSKQQLKCNCPPPGHPSGMEDHRACIKRGGGWGPHCGPPRP